MAATPTTKEYAMHKIGQALPLDVERAEDAYNAYVAQAEAAPHLWGAAQEAHADRLLATLVALYEQHNVAELDRIA